VQKERSQLLSLLLYYICYSTRGCSLLEIDGAVCLAILLSTTQVCAWCSWRPKTLILTCAFRMLFLVVLLIPPTAYDATSFASNIEHHLWLTDTFTCAPNSLTRYVGADKENIACSNTLVTPPAFVRPDFRE
jgi:hypothetical protein